ncbi:MarR family winged helix-turn-helix transcriptional regulator [Yersinia rochesterensis]|uniref:MarR family winged helix-turn-helix transcriptional regulator n=1 Tax=Yersinia rochesterensis TaxID=1604335 RepID=UPI00119D580B|nr:winged helix DNA-binding protein [Yersinia rochesterensis]MDN0105353.1 winged helix DNA-binding protein [Yersinia rochesterensis]
MDNEIIDLLRTVAASFHLRMKEQVVANDSGLSAFQAQLLNLIGRNDGISQQALGSFTERDKAQIARAIKELDTGGFVTRSLKASDKRTKCLTLTPAGSALHIQLNALRGQLAVEVLSSLDDDEKHALHVSLQKMAVAMSCTLRQ